MAHEAIPKVVKLSFARSGLERTHRRNDRNTTKQHSQFKGVHQSKTSNEQFTKKCVRQRQLTSLVRHGSCLSHFKFDTSVKAIHYRSLSSVFTYIIPTTSFWITLRVQLLKWFSVQTVSMSLTDSGSFNNLRNYFTDWSLSKFQNQINSSTIRI